MENNIISNWLKENGDSSIQKTVELKLAIITLKHKLKNQPCKPNEHQKIKKPL